MPDLTKTNLIRLLIRYGAAILAVVVSFFVRIALTAWVGDGLPTYITFYPAIMVVALLCGFSAGLVATATASLMVAYWILAPVGQFRIHAMVDIVGLAFFAGMGVFMSLVAELYHRTRRKTERYERELVLRESQERFRMLFDQAAVGIKRLDICGHVLEANDKFCEILGYSREEILRLSLSDYTHPDDLPAEQGKLAQLLEGQIPDYVMEKRCLRKDGGIIWVRVTNSVPAGSGRHSAWLISVVEDITERKQAEDALKMAKEAAERTAAELARSNRDLEQFAYVSSHDLQEPLRMVTAFMQLFEKKYSGTLDATGEQYIHYAVDGAKRMQQLIDDLLAYSRVDSRGGEPSPVDSKQVFEKALADLSLSITESHAHITSGDLPTVKADSAQLGQVFQNLIGNAIKFHGEMPPEVHVDAKREGDYWVFSVTDNGIGIDPEFHQKIFTIFQRLHTKDKYAGTGIGLAICKKIVDRHGGRMWLESTLGKGSMFYFTLPAQ